jgi:chromosome segregation ATPase
MTDEQPWHSLTEAARLTRLDREAIRSRARRDLLPTRKNNRGELLVQLPAELLAGVDQGADHPSTEELAGLRAAIADLTAEVSELRGDLREARSEAKAAERVAEAEVKAARDRLDRELDRVARLEEELRELRRPWWRWFVGK